MGTQAINVAKAQLASAHTQAYGNGLTYLASTYFESSPIYPGQDISDKIRLEVEFFFLELCVAEV